MRLLPLTSLACACVMIVSRLLTNRACATRGDEMVAAGTTSGFIPVWVSVMYVLGVLGLIITLIWSFFSPGWWGPLLVFVLYSLTGLVHSSVSDVNMLIRFNQSRKV
jgi:hypothetical protein